NVSRTAEGVADAAGKYSLTMTAGAVNRLGVEKAGYVLVRKDASPNQQRVATLNEGETLTMDLVVRRAAKLSGTVKGPDGALAGAKVSLMFGRANDVQQKSATTDAAGRYEFVGVDQGTVMVTATKEGFYLPDAPSNTWQSFQAPD